MAWDASLETPKRGVTPETQLLADDLAGDAPVIAELTAGGVPLTVRQGRTSLWLIAGQAGQGSVAVRAAWAPGGLSHLAVTELARGVSIAAQSEMGLIEAEITVPDPAARRWRVITRLAPRQNLRLTYWPRDLYPLGPDHRPTEVEVMAAQRGLNAGVVFCSLPDPSPGDLLYFQNFTALNPYFNATGTRPEGAVGGEGQELGYQPPIPNAGGDPGPGSLKSGEGVTLSDAILAISEDNPKDDHGRALAFLTLLAGAYRLIDKPATEWRDWPGRARRSLAALQRSPKVSTRIKGKTFIRPYVDAEHPDTMAQLAIARPLRDYGRWRGEPVLFEQRLRRAVPEFLDPKLKILRRYLPGVNADGLGPEKDPDEVDSWYLYHPLANLGRYALDGDEEARAMFLEAMPFAIKVARHFKYAWPVLFKLSTLKVVQQSRGEDKPGQSDVGGLYAYVMLQAHELTGEKRYVKEAEKGSRAMEGLAFDTLYQTNLTAWGAKALLKLHKLTGAPWHLGQFHSLLAGFFHNTIFWESDIGGARDYHTMLGATCLSDGPYMALYECYESFEAFRDVLIDGGDELPEPVRLLLSEYGRMALDRAWFYYPDALQPDAIAKDNIRNGHIDHALSIPVEDLYADGQPAGQVGQEVYGAGAAFIFALRGTHRLGRKAPFDLYSDYPLLGIELWPGRLTTRMLGLGDFKCRVRLLARSGTLPKVTLKANGETVPLKAAGKDLEAWVPGDSALELAW